MIDNEVTEELEEARSLLELASKVLDLYGKKNTSAQCNNLANEVSEVLNQLSREGAN